MAPRIAAEIGSSWSFYALGKVAEVKLTTVDLICYGNTAGRGFKPYTHFDMNARFEARPDPKDGRPGKYLTDTGIDIDAVLCQVGFNQAGKTIKAGDKEAITKAIKENEDAGSDMEDEGDSDME